MPLFFGQVDPRHVINWIVVRHPDFVANMKNLQPRRSDDNGVDAMAFKNANALIRHLQIEGPIRPEQPHFTYDKRNDLYHSHAVNAAPTYNVLWEADENLRLIHVLDIAPHENFNYTRNVNKKQSIENALTTLQTTPHYKKMFEVAHMRLNPSLGKIYENFVTGTSSTLSPPTAAVKALSYEEMEVEIRKSPKNS